MPRYQQQMELRDVLAQLLPGMSALVAPGLQSITATRAQLNTLAKELKVPIDITLASITVTGEPTEKMIRITRRKA